MGRREYNFRNKSGLNLERNMMGCWRRKRERDINERESKVKVFLGLKIDLDGNK